MSVTETEPEAPNGHDQRARPGILGVIEASLGRALLDWMLGAGLIF